MSRLLKIAVLLFFCPCLKGQVFVRTDSVPTTISKIAYRFLPMQSENDFNFLFYSTKNKKQNFELVTLNDTVISRMEIKNKGLDGGGSWYKSAVMSNDKLLLLHVDGYLVLYEKNKKHNYVLKKVLTIKGKHFDLVSFLDKETILLANSYNDNNKKLYGNYALHTYNLRKNNQTK